jgi:hypothetical protein
MKRIYPKLYISWIVLSTILCILSLCIFYPNYENNEFPLFTDISLLLFLAAFFILSYLLVHLLALIINNKSGLKYAQRLLIQFALMLISFLFSLTFMDFNLVSRVIVSFTCFISVIPHFALTMVFSRKVCEQ